MAMKFAMELLDRELLDREPQKNPNAPQAPDRAAVTRFTNAVENIFLYRQGEITIRHDHSLAYRHRNKNRYPYQEFTFQELTGLINKLYQKILAPRPASFYEVAPHHFNDRNLALFQLTNSSDLLIDNRKRLLEVLRKPVPVALFLGASIKYELDFFVLQRIRDHIGLRLDEELTEALVRERGKEATPVYVFCPDKPLGRRTTVSSLEAYVLEKGDMDLRLLHRHKLLRIVGTEQWCVGIHLNQLGAEALKVLARIKQQHGYLVAVDNQAPLMSDILDMDRFHIGKVEDDIAARIMGIPEGSGFVQYVPAGLRTTLAFPTPVQTARDFSEALGSELYARVTESMGEKVLHAHLKEDAENRGTPIVELLDHLAGDPDSGSTAPVSSGYVSGIYDDGMPWNGALAKADISGSDGPWYFAAFTAGAGRKKVTDFVEDFEKQHGKTVQIAWNGGYILNAELVGKLGLPESYIGTPLGLVVSEGKTLCPPLFNKPAFLVFPDGRLDIRRVSCEGGFTLSDGERTLEFHLRNPESPPSSNELCFYDLMFPEDRIPSQGRVIARLAGNRVMEIIRSGSGGDVSVIPVGLTLSFPERRFPKSWAKPERELEIRLLGWEEPLYAVEAGPMLVDKGRCCIDMEEEGWKAAASIKTQAARLDYLDMRGPKIAIGLDSKGDLSVLTINGRIRESVGAAHGDMAEILIANGVVKAMGFDPGGSSTLYAGGAVLNISPYNSDYEREVIALPPEPRPVGNAVLGWRERGR